MYKIMIFVLVMFFGSYYRSAVRQSASGSCCICTAQQPVCYTYQWQGWGSMFSVSV